VPVTKEKYFPLTINSTTPQIPALSHFLEGYMGLNWTDKNGEALRSIKVAVIDNGVIALNSIPQNGHIDLTLTPNTSPSLKLLKHLKKGRHTSFFHPDGSESPWWHADDPHGTQMANLIAAIDPRCALYIARVCSHVEANDIRIEQVIKVGNEIHTTDPPSPPLDSIHYAHTLVF
jgi:hypothetical protein